MVGLARMLLTVALTAFAVPVVSVGVSVTLGEATARAEDGGDIAIGTELQATTDVTLHRAEIAKGSRVSVTKVVVRAGKIDGVNVALADGHVVTVTVSQLHTFFRVVQD